MSGDQEHEPETGNEDAGEAGDEEAGAAADEAAAAEEAPKAPEVKPYRARRRKGEGGAKGARDGGKAGREGKAARDGEGKAARDGEGKAARGGEKGAASGGEAGAGEDGDGEDGAGAVEARPERREKREQSRDAGPDWLEKVSDNAWLGIVLLAAAAIPVGIVQGAAAALLVLIAAALVTVIALFWSSVRTLLGETPITGADAYAMAAPRAEEEQKQAVLRALKDLEFERSVGKISEQHYAELVTKYRAEAKRLLRVLDDEAEVRRERVEHLVRKRLLEAGLAPDELPADTHRSPAPDPKKKRKKGKGGEASAPATTVPSPFVSGDEGDADDAAPEGELPPERRVVIEPIEEEVAPQKPRSRGNVDVTWKSAPSTKTKESAAYVPLQKVCDECGAKNDADANFCKKCGSKSLDGGGPNDARAAEEEAQAEEEAKAARDSEEASR
ncbi:MAG: zinc ribbon domain-containing protein [Polyangiaceae bacterium]